jgi:regulatory protein
MAVPYERNKKPRPPLDKEGLERLALFYAGRYATTRAKLKSYLGRKLKERGWEGESEPPLDRLVERFSELGYVDDKAFAAAKGASLQRRGFGARRIGQALHAAGIEEADSAEAREAAETGAWDSALRFARRKRIGPFASEEPDREARARAFAAMMRAGHPTDVVRRMLDLRAGEVPNPDEM